MGTSATSPLRSPGSPKKWTKSGVAHKWAEVLRHHTFVGVLYGRTKSKVAHKWAEVLGHRCVLGGPQPRGQRQRLLTSGQKCYFTPALWWGPYRRGQKQNKSGSK